MKLRLTLCSGLLVIGGVVGITQTRTSLNELQAERRQLLREQAELHDSLSILRAEFAHLSSPQRLAQLAARQGLQPLDPAQLHRWHAYVSQNEAGAVQ